MFSCNSMSLYLRENIVPKIYKTFWDDCDYSEDQLTMGEFLKSFGLKYISHKTAWCWMKCVGFKYLRDKKYFCDRHKDVSNQ